MMEDSKSVVRRWEDMEIDILVRIFKEFDVIQLTSGISRVCSSWRLACSDPLLWKTIDLGILKSNFIQIPSEPYIWVDERSNKQLTRMVKITMGLSRKNVNCIIFHFNLYPKDDHLTYIAERYLSDRNHDYDCKLEWNLKMLHPFDVDVKSPRLKRLVLPAWNLMTKGGICNAIRKWTDLESMTMPFISSPSYIMKEIGASCKNFSQLKVMGNFDSDFAWSIIGFLPKLKVLSLRCSVITTEALVLILDHMAHLEVLNVSHCLFFEEVLTQPPRRIFRELDEAIVEKASQLQAFYYCREMACVLCQRMVKDKGNMRWFKYEDSWRADEVSSLVS